jgi:hypothetical protein
MNAKNCFDILKDSPTRMQKSIFGLVTSNAQTGWGRELFGLSLEGVTLTAAI